MSFARKTLFSMAVASLFASGCAREEPPANSEKKNVEPDWKTLVNQALAHRKKREYDKALELLEKAVPLAVDDKAKKLTEAYLLDNCKLAGKYDRALPMQLAALAAGEAAQKEKPDEAKFAELLSQTGHLYRAMGKYEEAEAIYRRALGIRERVVGPESTKVAKSLNALGYCLMMTDRNDDAEACITRALRIREKARGPDNFEVAVTLETYAKLLRRTKREAEAVAAETRAKAIFAKTPAGEPGGDGELGRI